MQVLAFWGEPDGHNRRLDALHVHPLHFATNRDTLYGTLHSRIISCCRLEQAQGHVRRHLERRACQPPISSGLKQAL